MPKVVRDRPKKTWMEVVQNDRKTLQLDNPLDCSKWKRLVVSWMILIQVTVGVDNGLVASGGITYLGSVV